VENSLREQETKWSIDAITHDAWEPEWITKRFSAHLTCSDKSCGEGAVVLGTIRGESDFDYDSSGKTISKIDYRIFPKFIHPPPSVICIPERTSDDIKKEIKLSSALIWTDLSSSANKLRQTTERIMTELGIKKTKIGKKGDRIPISLKERIDMIKTKKPEISNLLHSIRFLGNYGSHETKINVDRNDLLSAFEIIEHVLDLCFSTKNKNALRAAKDISRRKGKPTMRRKNPF